MATKLSSRIGGFFEVLNSAAAVASATELGRRPRARDLRRLGIDPAQFNSTRTGR